jgi:hypothetical protein
MKTIRSTDLSFDSDFTFGLFSMTLPADLHAPFWTSTQMDDLGVARNLTEVGVKVVGEDGVLTVLTVRRLLKRPDAFSAPVVIVLPVLAIFTLSL